MLHAEPVSYIAEPVSYIAEPLCYIAEPLCYTAEPLCYITEHTIELLSDGFVHSHLTSCEMTHTSRG
jgi:hypothetical protein